MIGNLRPAGYHVTATTEVKLICKISFGMSVVTATISLYAQAWKNKSWAGLVQEMYNKVALHCIASVWTCNYMVGSTFIAEKLTVFLGSKDRPSCMGVVRCVKLSTYVWKPPPYIPLGAELKEWQMNLSRNMHDFSVVQRRNNPLVYPQHMPVVLNYFFQLFICKRV